MENTKPVATAQDFADNINKKEIKKNGNRNNFSVSKRKWKH